MSRCTVGADPVDGKVLSMGERSRRWSEPLAVVAITAVLHVVSPETVVASPVTGGGSV